MTTLSYTMVVLRKRKQLVPRTFQSLYACTLALTFDLTVDICGSNFDGNLYQHYTQLFSPKND